MARYNEIPTINVNMRRAYRTTRYPIILEDINDTYVYTIEGDRMDIIANDYYQDTSLWWVISRANPQLKQNSLYLPEGIQIRIPSNIEQILEDFNTLNS